VYLYIDIINLAAYIGCICLLYKLANIYTQPKEQYSNNPQRSVYERLQMYANILVVFSGAVAASLVCVLQTLHIYYTLIAPEDKAYAIVEELLSLSLTLFAYAYIIAIRRFIVLGEEGLALYPHRRKGDPPIVREL